MALFRLYRSSATLTQLGKRTMVSVTIDSNDGIATISLDKKPVNSLSLEFMTEIEQQIGSLETRSDVRGLVVTSSLKNVFCAGLDLNELHDFQEQRVKNFWDSLRNLWLRLYSCQLPIAAAVTGHAPAGGTLIAVSTDYRVMVDDPKLTLGLNEARFGMVAPLFLAQTFQNVIGDKLGERHLMLGTLFDPKSAFQAGLVDELASDREDAIAKCKAKVAQFAQSDRNAFHATKMKIRGPFIEEIKAGAKADTEWNYQMFKTEDFQKRIGNHLENVKRKAQEKRK